MSFTQTVTSRRLAVAEYSGVASFDGESGKANAATGGAVDSGSVDATGKRELAVRRSGSQPVRR
ncbi:MAG: hypothetical protein J2P17_10300 [Mycobacterium sp.]|nr:hypothetical protein [Mycobacterium sp.]